MRRLLGPGVGAAVCALVMAGCAATTDPPSDVTASSAIFRAQGRTDSTPAHYFFQYSVNPNALGTGFGQQTPTRGPIPAGVQTSGGGLVSFSEAVSGLKPATTYYFRVCGGDGQTRGDVCAQVRSFTTRDGVAFDRPGTYSWSVPAGVTRAQFDLGGAEGGQGWASSPDGPGGRGAHVRASLAVRSGQAFTIVVGGRGGDAGQSNGAGAGGFGGGAFGGGGFVGHGGGGGGGTDVRTGAGDASGLATRLLVAGAGGGGAPGTGGSVHGGAGGATGANGQDGTCSPSPCDPVLGGGGGTATAGGRGATGVHSNHNVGNPDGGDGALGLGGAGGSNTYVDGQLLIAGVGAGGGGGGYFGGGGGGAGYVIHFYGYDPSGGGGGSSFITRTALCSSPIDTGVQSGDGAVAITYNPGPC